MSKNAMVGSGLLILGLVCFSIAVSVPPPAPPVVGANGDPTPVAALPWGTLITTLLSAFGGGSFLAAIKAFWSRAEPFVTPILHQVTPAVQVPVAPVVAPTPMPVPPIQVKDFEEFVAAAMAYQKDKSNLALLRRFAIATNTEIYDAIGIKSPTVATQVNGLLTSLINEFIPVPADPMKAA